MKRIRVLGCNSPPLLMRGRKIKRVPRNVFLQSIEDFVEGRITAKEAARRCGISVGTYVTRTDQYLMPEAFGELPKDFFLPDVLPDLGDYGE